MKNVETAFQNNNFDSALSQLNKSKINKAPRNKLLYLMNLGSIAFGKRDFIAANAHFEQAYNFTEDAEKRNIRDAYAYVTNPMMTDYAGENHEILLINYYKALCYLNMNQLPEALIEVRRMDNRLKRLSTLYSNENRYKTDAFINLLMGIIYDASADYNNAFIAYRNSYNTYKNTYQKMYGVSAPYQLKVDLIRAAYKTGFTSEGQAYEKEFGIKYIPEPRSNATFIALWHNGMAPYKTENAVTFVSKPGAGGVIDVSNSDLGFATSFSLPSNSSDANNLSNLTSFRIALPSYRIRNSFFTQASLSFDGGNGKPLEMAEDIAQIAPQCLHDRLAKDLAQSIARLVIKKATEYALNEAAKAEMNKKDKKDQNAGAILSGLALGAMIFNTANEKADTRNWQLLPASISYTRYSLPAGKHSFNFKASGSFESNDTKDSIGLDAGATHFHTFTTSATLPY